MKNSSLYDLIIVSQAAAAFSAALYAGRYKMSALIIGEELGGETVTTNIIENYPGHPQIVAPGAEAYKRDLPDAEIHLLDTGHFALETHGSEIAALINNFLLKQT